METRTNITICSRCNRILYIWFKENAHYWYPENFSRRSVKHWHNGNWEDKATIRYELK